MTRSSCFKLIFSILAFILSVLIVFSVFKFVFSGSSLSFSSFLNWLGTVNDIKINFSISDFYITGDWGLFDFLRSFFNVFTQLIAVLVYLATQFINLLIFIGQFLVFLFS